MTEKTQIYGGTFTLLPRKEGGFGVSTTIMCGTEKTNIRILKTLTGSITDTSSTFAFTLMQEVRKFVDEIMSYNPEGQVACTFSIAAEANMTPVLSMIRNQNLGTIWSQRTLEALGNAQIIPDPRVKIQLIEKACIEMVGDIIRSNGVNQHALRFRALDMRFISNQADNSGIDVETKAKLAEKELGIVDIEKIRSGVKAFHESGTPINGPVRAATQRIAHKYVKMTLDAIGGRKDGIALLPRFIRIPSQRDIFNDIYGVEELRDIFLKTYMQGLGLTHNVCIKPYGLGKNPPLTDILVTVIADMMDERDGTKAGVVSIDQ